MSDRINKFRSLKIPMYLKISLSFIGLLIVLATIIAFSSYSAQQNMESYLRDKMEERFNAAIEELDLMLANEDWTYGDPDMSRFLDDYSLRHDLRFELKNMEGATVYSNYDLFRGPEESDADGRKEDKDLIFRGMRPQYDEGEIIFTIDGDQVGVMSVRYFDLKLMSTMDLAFFDTMETVFRNALIAIVIICLIISFFLARSITVPLKKIGRTAGEIGEGDLQARVKTDSNALEIEQLGEAINQLAQTLEKEDLLRKQLTSDMAHEIRTPITALRNFFEAFIDGVFEPNEENMTKCHDEIVRMSELVDRLKDIANIEEQNLLANPVDLNISDEVVTMADLLRPEFMQKNLALDLTVPENVSIFMDQNQFRQIITNLLTNAMRYTDEGTVSVSLISDAKQVELIVEDTGVGMSQEDADMIFERFYRADKSRNRATGGMGVGLTIVKNLVESHKGTIKVDSELGVGSKFTVTLPHK